MSKLDNPKTIWKLLSVLAKQQNDLGLHGNTPRAKRLRQEVGQHFTPVQRELLDKADENEHAFPKGMFLHLPPDEKGGHPVMKVSFDDQNGHIVFRVKAAILVEHEEDNNGETKKVHYGIGIRFEGPEGPKGTSNHDYPHAQWFSSFDKDLNRLPGCPQWLPDVHPAIPIAAETAVDILCCALKSFYGASSEPLQWLAKSITKDRALQYALGTDTLIRIKNWARLE